MGTSAQFSQYRSKRDYRGVLFSCPAITDVQQVIQLFDGLKMTERNQKGLASLSGENVSGTRAIYRSETCFLRTSNELRKQALKAEKAEGLYEYEVCVLRYSNGPTPVFLVAVPFSGMARELFGKIHSSKPSADFIYLRPALNDLVKQLLSATSKLERIRTVGINWTIAGDTGRSDQITLRGTDVVHSAAFKHLQDPKSNLSLALRKIQIVHETADGRKRLKLTFDKFGNYGVWATEETANLPDVFEVFELFRRSKLIESESAFPVRNREDEPLMP